MPSNEWIEKKCYDALEAKRNSLRDQLAKAREHNHALQVENTRVIDERRKVELERDNLNLELAHTEAAFGTLTDLRREIEVLKIERDTLRAEVGRLLAAIEWHDNNERKSQCEDTQ